MIRVMSCELRFIGGSSEQQKKKQMISVLLHQLVLYLFHLMRLLRCFLSVQKAVQSALETTETLPQMFSISCKNMKLFNINQLCSASDNLLTCSQKRTA